METPLKVVFIYFFFISFCLTHSQGATIGTPTNLDSSLFQNPATNWTSVSAPPSDFSVVPVFTGQLLSSTSCLMNAVNAMVSIALGDFSGFMQQTAYRLRSSYSDLGIVVTPSDPGGSIFTPFVVWGLVKAINYMIITTRFLSVKFRIFVGRRLLGYIDILEANSQPSLSFTGGASPAQISAPSEPPPLPGTPLNSTKISGSADQGGVSNAGNLKIFFKSDGITLSETQVFMGVIGALGELAPLGTKDPVPEDSITVPLAMTQFSWYNLLDPPRTPENPPYFELSWLIKTLGSIPKYMLDKGVFSELHAVIVVDDVPLADIWLRKSIALEGSLQPPTLNVSVS